MRLLIVSPHFPPSNAADMQRVRLLLPYLREQGIEVLSVEPDQVAAPQDPWLAAGLPTNVVVHRVKALDLKWGKVPGLGMLSFRAIGALRRRGDELLERNVEGGKRKARFDLVYFSTTQFGLHVLGPRWKRKFGVPFMMDYQDPWVSDYYRDHPEVTPPGGRLKYGIASWLNRRQEPKVLRECSGITSVSPAYPQQLAKRYPWLRVEDCGKVESRRSRVETEKSPQRVAKHAIHRLPSLTIPFPGDERDFDRVKAENIKQEVFDPSDGLIHWVYVGVCPSSMLFSVRSMFAALAVRKAESDRQKLKMEKLRLHFIGTSYAAAGTGVKIVEPLAAEYGLSKWVYESTDRIPYSETLRCLLDADALIVPGSDDPGYTASKIYPYLLARKPLLAVFHEQSSVVPLIRKVAGGSVVTFASGENVETIAARILQQVEIRDGRLPQISLNEVAFQPFTAEAQAKQLADFWKHCLENR
ncbi:MAG: hypothetical protein ABIT76_00745 [Chthoniobacterales bacterium]